MASRQLKAGIPVSLSGQFQVQGRQALAGLQAWARDVNASGGVWVQGLGERLAVTVRHYDDGSRSDPARRATQRLISEDQVDLLFGPYSSVLTRATAEVASDVYTDDGNATQNDGYVVIDLYAGHTGLRLGTARLQPFVKIANIFDATYVGSVVVNAFGGRYFEPAPGRTVQAGVNLSL